MSGAAAPFAGRLLPRCCHDGQKWLIAGKPQKREKPHLRGFPSAPRETRTPTGHTAHKALNLARLPIPPQAQAGANYSVGDRPNGPGLKSSERLGTLRTHVRISAKNPASKGEHMVELKLTKRQQEIFDFIKR